MAMQPRQSERPAPVAAGRTLYAWCDIRGCEGRHGNAPEDDACPDCGGFFCEGHLDAHDCPEPDDGVE